MAVRMVNQSLVLLVAFCTCTAVSLDSERRCENGGDCVLTCTAVNKPGVQYKDLRWSKETPEGLDDLLIRALPNGTTRYIGLRREVQLLEDRWDILLPNVSFGDSGTYLCRLADPVGEQSPVGRLNLAVTGGPDGPPRLQVLVFVVLATVMLVGALLLFTYSYGRLKDLLRERSKVIIKRVSLGAHLHPLDLNELKSIQTLGPKWSNGSKTKHLNI
ncbi:CD83 antigen [Gadus morhua]|uniref:Ig-like domain-containing protein n=1 Tax=Gadus morhua TaxID=8049 RepID=A0A8C4ZRX7_GADMO|nr:CD83 antigen [Gadus morhua]